MSHEHEERDASAETQVLRIVPVPGPDKPARRPWLEFDDPLPEEIVDPLADTDPLTDTDPFTDTDPLADTDPLQEAQAATPQPEPTRSQPTIADILDTTTFVDKPSIPAAPEVPPEPPPETLPAPLPEIPAPVASTAPAETTRTSAQEASEKPDEADNGGFNGPPDWQQSVPFDKTGVLLRPESLRHKAMQAETELITLLNLEKLREEDGSEAAQSQRPGFWTGAWARRGLLAAILLVQAILTLRNNNSPFEDESLYLYSGHLELGHLLFGSSTITDFWSEFSGAPVLYPVAGAVADQVGGIFAARLLNLVLMLATTGLLYAITRRFFGTRAALGAAALYSFLEATIFLGGLATYDAPALFLIALAVWLVVRFASATLPIYLLAIFPAALAVGIKYVSLLFLPSIVVLALLVSLPYFGRWAVIRPIALTIGLTMVIYVMYKAAGPSGAQGISVTTTSRAQGSDSVMTVLQTAGQWGGDLFAVALIGALCVIRLPRRHPHPAIPRPRWQRIGLAVLLVGTALLAPAYQAHLHTTVSIQKHVGFGLFFAAPLAGYGLVRLVGPHLHRAQLGIGILVLNFALGMGQSLYVFHSWPNSYSMISELVKYQKPGANYFVGNASNAIYQLRGDPDAEPTQFTDAFYFRFESKPGVFVTGDAAYAAAIEDGYFRVIAYDFSADPAVEASIAADLYHAANYRMVAQIPSATSGGPGYAYVWVRKQG